MECQVLCVLLTAECHANNSRQELGEEENDVIYQSEPWVCMVIRYGYFWRFDPQNLLVWVVATQIFFIFTPKLGEMMQFDQCFSDGLV